MRYIGGGIVVVFVMVLYVLGWIWLVSFSGGVWEMLSVEGKLVYGVCVFGSLVCMIGGVRLIVSGRKDEKNWMSEEWLEESVIECCWKDGRKRLMYIGEDEGKWEDEKYMEYLEDMKVFEEMERRGEV